MSYLIAELRSKLVEELDNLDISNYTDFKCFAIDTFRKYICTYKSLVLDGNNMHAPLDIPPVEQWEPFIDRIAKKVKESPDELVESMNRMDFSELTAYVKKLVHNEDLYRVKILEYYLVSEQDVSRSVISLICIYLHILHERTNTLMQDVTKNRLDVLHIGGFKRKIIFPLIVYATNNVLSSDSFMITDPTVCATKQ